MLIEQDELKHLFLLISTPLFSDMRQLVPQKTKCIQEIYWQLERILLVKMGKWQWEPRARVREARKKYYDNKGEKNMQIIRKE